MIRRIAEFVILLSPLIILPLYFASIVVRHHFVTFLSAYASLTTLFFVLEVYILGLIELGLVFSIMLSHLPFSLLLLNACDYATEKLGLEAGGHANLWIYHLACQAANCGSLFVIRAIWR
jgi:hypothetical protein